MVAPPLTTTTPTRAPAPLPLHRAIGNHAFGTLLEGAAHGSAREVPYRAEMESAFGTSFAGVRAFTGQASALSRFGAGGAASQNTVAFGPTEPSRRLVAHELTHLVQQRRGAGAAGTQGLAEVEADHHADRVARGGRAGAVAASAPAVALSPKNPFDDAKAATSAAEAVKAVKAYQALTPVERRAAVKASYRVQLAPVLALIPKADQVTTFADTLREIGRWVEELETEKSAGTTEDKIAARQAKFITEQAEHAAKEKAKAAAKAKKAPVKAPTAAEIEAARKEELAKTSIPPSTTSWWAGLSGKDQADWIKRGNAAIAAVVAHAKAHHPELGLSAANFNLDFPGVEARGAGVVAAGNPAQVGKDFVTSVELNPAYVMDVVVHEVFGHPEYGPYGNEYHLSLYDKAAAKVSGYTKPASGSDERTTELDAYAYQETEIYAVLRSMSYRTAPTKAHAAQVPDLDTQGLVDWHVELMKQQWSPKLIVAILRGLRKRLMIDPRITPAARKVFDKAVRKNFGAKTAAAVLKS
ncbi:MAG TPA: DUF4157 domain-containing protein [Polyangiaceae bacterium]|nr:DUF4157 domain-containing protein [Polyangiaceae bacterium]